VLEHLGLGYLFDEVFHIGSAGYSPKPSVEAFQRIEAAHGINPATTAFFEDSEKNLAPAALLGMTTILVGAHAAASTADFVHHRTHDLAGFLTSARLKEA
jgi:putative hydrolase of the HAD superfamily